MIAWPVAHFALDVRSSLSRPTGVGSYVLALATRLPALAPDDRFFYFSASMRERYQARPWPPNVSLVDRRLPVRALNYSWNHLAWPPLDLLVGASLDLVHSPTPLRVPGRRARQVVTVHDLFFLKHPDMTRAEIRADYVPLVRDHVRAAHGVICVSEHTAREAHLLLDVPPEKIAVIPNGVDPDFFEPLPEGEVAEVLARRRLPRGGLLYVGSDEKRKNLVNLVMAYLGLARRRPRDLPPLVLVGPGSGWAQAGEFSQAQIHSLGYLDKREVRALMQVAAALVFPSLEEGFGLPVVEAFAAGLPVVCSRGSALEEVAGQAATLVNPLDAASIATGIEGLLDDPARAAEQRRLGRERARLYDWERAARQTLEFYRRVLGQWSPGR